MNDHAQLSEDESVTTLPDIFARLAARRWWIISSVLFVTTIFLIAAFVMKPVYRASVVLAPAHTERESGGGLLSSSPLGGLVSTLGGGTVEPEVAEALAVLRSRQFTEEFIVSRNLIPRFFPKLWDPERGTWKVSRRAPTPAKAYKYFETIRSIIEERKTGLITLQIDWRDRIEASDWANEIVRRLNQEMRNRAIASSDASLHFLEKELSNTSTVEVRQAISRLMEAQVKRRMVADVTPDYSFRIVDRAIPADADDPIRPKKAIMVLIGAFIGLVCGCVAVLIVDAFTPRTTTSPRP